MTKWPLGVFVSIDEGRGVHLDVARELGVPTAQLRVPSKKMRMPENASNFLARLDAMQIQLTAVFGGFEGESYADIPTVHRTVGLVPPETRADRLQEMIEIADFARLLHCCVVALHLGCIPHKTAAPLYSEVVSVTRALCDHCGEHQQALHLETGQESADNLLAFIDKVNRPNLFVNFDPANMILYGTGEPITALRKIGAFVRSVHCKDARWSTSPRQQWGTEFPLGEGEVGIENYLSTLDDIGYAGPLTIEREISEQPMCQKEQIGGAIQLLEELKQKLAT